MNRATSPGFERVGPSQDVVMSESMGGSIGSWPDVWRRLRSNRLAMVGIYMIALLILVSAIGPLMRPFTYQVQDLNHTDLGPGSVHWLGTDFYGRDMWVRVWEGCRISLFVGFTAAVMDVAVGVVYGGVSAYYGGKVDAVLMRIVEIIIGVPTMILNVLMIVWLNRGLISIIVALVFTGWIGMARLVRGQLMQLREQEFILAARVLGAGPRRIILKHLIPNTMGMIVVQLTFTIPSAIFSEAVLSFLGLGVRIPRASLGSMVVDGLGSLRFAPHELFVPGIILSLIMFAFNVLGDGLRDAMDPRLRK